MWVRSIKAGCVMCLLLTLAACGARSAGTPTPEKIEGHWLLTSIDGKPVQTFAQQESPGLFFDVSKLEKGKLTGRLGGSDGCNKLLGNSVFAENDALAFGPIG